jgi:hypothetical protein
MWFQPQLETIEVPMKRHIHCDDILQRMYTISIQALNQVVKSEAFQHFERNSSVILLLGSQCWAFEVKLAPRA